MKDKDQVKAPGPTPDTPAAPIAGKEVPDNVRAIQKSVREQMEVHTRFDPAKFRRKEQA